MSKKEWIEIPILFGSQTGNSKGAAEDLAKNLPSRLSTPTLTIKSRAICLDDFLELNLVSPSYNPTSSSSKVEAKKHGSMPPIFCIICSSYGVGQAPLGAYNFRELCDNIINDQDDKLSSLFDGCHYALLGLGDSKYSTFFLNPIALDGGLSKAGARRVGRLGKADASGKEKTQAKVVEEWCEAIVSDLKLVLKERQMKQSNDEESKSLYQTAGKILSFCKEEGIIEWKEKTSTPFQPFGADTGPFDILFCLLVLIPIILTIVYGVFIKGGKNQDEL